MSDTFQIVIKRPDVRPFHSLLTQQITLNCTLDTGETNVHGTDLLALLVAAEIEANRTGTVRVHINEK